MEPSTIFALSSGRLPAAIAVVRVSGPRAGNALAALARRMPAPREAMLARLRDPANDGPIDDALVLELMHWADEIVAPGTLEIPSAEKLPEKEMQMARMLVDTMSVDEFEPEKFTNNYHDELLKMIEARAEGKELPKPKKAPARAKVVNLMDVLAQSLEESKKRRAEGNGKAASSKRRKTTAA